MMWCFRFESWLGLLPEVGGNNLATYLEQAVLSEEAAIDEALRDHHAALASRTIFHILVQLVAGRALVIVRRTERGNGFLAWKQLKKEYEDGGGHRLVALLMGLLNPSWPPSASPRQFMDILDEWETSVDQYEKQTGQRLAQSVMIAVVMKHAPREVQGALRIQLPGFGEDYQALRSAVTVLARGLTSFNEHGVATDDIEMPDASVNWIKGKQQKGKGKPPKGKGKKGKEGKQKGGKNDRRGSQEGKATRPKFEGKCHNCGKTGHKASECWWGKGRAAEVSGEPNRQKAEAAAVTADTESEGERNDPWVFAIYSGVDDCDKSVDDCYESVDDCYESVDDCGKET